MSDFLIELDEDMVEVIGPSGANFSVMNQKEADYFELITERYTKDNYFTNVSDLQDLDRCLIMETMCYRWGLWISMEKDYFGNNIDMADTKKSLNDYSKELRLLKKSLGMDKVSRDKDKGESIAEWIKGVQVRAKEFGIMRNEQSVRAITLIKELFGLVQYHDNCLPEERKEYRIEANDIIEWVRTIKPEFDEIDAKFREEKQAYWIREM